MLLLSDSRLFGGKFMLERTILLVWLENLKIRSFFVREKEGCMECLQIDWKNVDITFERDEFYESIQAPKWVDFTAPQLEPVDDQEWFCGGAGCTHTAKALLQTEESVLSDSQTNRLSQVIRNSASVTDITTSGVGGDNKRAEGLILSSYSSMSGIKEAFAKHRVLRPAKTPCDMAENSVHALKRPAPASENQNPNRTFKAELQVSKIPTMTALQGFSKKMKMTESKHVPGKQSTQKVLLEVSKSKCSVLSEQLNQSQIPPVMDDLSKLTGLLGRKHVLQKKSSLHRPALIKQQDKKVLTDVCSASQPKIKKDELTRAPFSVYGLRTAVVPSLAVSSEQTTISARSYHSFQRGNEKPTSTVARKAHQARIVDMQPSLTADGCRKPAQDVLLHGSNHRIERKIMQAKCKAPILNKKKLETDGTSAYQQSDTSSNEGCVSALQMVQEPCNTMKEKPLMLHECDEGKVASHCGKDNERKPKAREEESFMLTVLEKRVKNLNLSTPNSKLALRIQKLGKAMTKMGQMETSNKASLQETGQPQSSQHEDNVLACQINVSNTDVEKNPKKQLHIVKDRQKKQGTKRKSSELNFRFNCSSRDHKHGNEKMLASGGAVSSSGACRQAMPSSLARSSEKTPPLSSFMDSCKEQHKKRKAAKAQPFKPFRFRTEERGALRELGLAARKEQAVPNPQEQIHRAMRMPSFGHPFQPQRSTKKLTVPKEPSFCASRPRKAQGGHPTELG